MTSLRTQRELEWHEHESQRRRSLNHILYDPPAFDSVVRAGIAFIEPQPGERVLDLGSGEGKETAWLARAGSRVVSMDLSHVQLMDARKSFDAVTRARVMFVQADAERLPFAAGAFRVIYGKAVLHHLDLSEAAREIHRVLEPRGKAAFAEPLASAPLFWFARRLTPQYRSRDERPMTRADAEEFVRAFAAWEIREIFLLAPLAYAVRLFNERMFRWLHAHLARGDTILLARAPVFRRWAWYGLIHIVAPGETNWH